MDLDPVPSSQLIFSHLHWTRSVAYQLRSASITLEECIHGDEYIDVDLRDE